MYCVTWAVLHITNENPDEQIGPKDADKFQIVVFIGMFIGLVFTIIFHIFVKESSSSETYGSLRFLFEKSNFIFIIIIRIYFYF